MSYQFNASTLRPQSKVKVGGEIATVSLLTRRTIRQNRRAQRAL
ncbi:hypothetical protein [Algimonas arctica]|nr:hypothetical protein [Algimonas arctica]